MRFNQGFALFIVAFICIALPIFFNTTVSAKSADINNEYSAYLITATEACVASVAENKVSYIFDTESSRQLAVDTFYETLSKCFNYDYTTYRDLLKYYVPCLFLIDTDGYYISYSEEYSDANGNHLYSDIITPINKWSKYYYNTNDSSYEVEFHLDDTITVVYMDGTNSKTLTGNYLDVYTALEKPGALSALCSNGYSAFDQIRTEIIIGILNNQMEYYINAHNNKFADAQLNIQYQFTLPQVTGEDWARLIDMPTAISFLQGMQTPYSDTYLNIYSFAGAEIERRINYYIDATTSADGLRYYHVEGCPLYTGGYLKPYSMEEAAKKGAFPCHECIH